MWLVNSLTTALVFFWIICIPVFDVLSYLTPNSTWPVTSRHAISPMRVRVKVTSCCVVMCVSYGTCLWRARNILVKLHLTNKRTQQTCLRRMRSFTPDWTVRQKWTDPSICNISVYVLHSAYSCLMRDCRAYFKKNVLLHYEELSLERTMASASL